MADNNQNKKQYYLGNESLPTPSAEFEWTPEMINHLKRSKKNLLYFAEHFFYIITESGRRTITLHSFQKRALRRMRDNRFVVMLASRQVGKTTMMTIYALWNACFNDDQRILIVANKEKTAIEIFKRIRMAYEELPNWLKPGVIEYGKTSLTLGNGTSIGISTTTGTAARGMSCNVLVLDELAFIENNLVEDFWRSVYPIISSFKKSKIFIASTPNGTENLFYKLYQGARRSENNWTAERIDWHEVPGRDEQWKQDTIRSLGSKEAFDQEFGNVFLETGESVLGEDIVKKCNLTIQDAPYIFDSGCYKLWQTPDQDKLYTAGVDISEGIGQAASCIQVFDITDLTNIEQVAVYHNDKISPFKFAEKVAEILKHWYSPPVLIERNNCGAGVVDNLNNIHGYENIVTYAPSTGKLRFDRQGVLAHTNTKYKGVVNMRYWINELMSVTLRDIDTLNELKNFVRYPNGTWASRKGENMWDDRVMSMIWSLMILEPSITEKYFEIQQFDDNNKPLVLRGLDRGPRSYLDPITNYYNEKYDNNNPNVLPTLMSGEINTSTVDEDSLHEAGWRFLDNNGGYY